MSALERWKEEMPKEEEMLPRDKYTIFDRKAKRYRKGIHSTYSGRVNSFRGGWGREWPAGTENLANFLNRTAKVDKSIAENQPAGLLRRKKTKGRRSEATTALAAMCLFSLFCRVQSGLYDIPNHVYIETKEWMFGCSNLQRNNDKNYTE